LDVAANGSGLALKTGSGLSGTNTKGKDAYKIGIRPEHLVVVEGPHSSDGIGLEVKVNVLEPVGAESYVYASLEDGGPEIVIRVSSHARHEPGEKLTLKAAAKDVHFFDAENERRID
jgi:sn-glycerol 3-phosphate transport system ATP-binding protein